MIGYKLGYRNNQKSDVNKLNKKCKYCKKAGHFEEECWKKYSDLIFDWAKAKTGMGIKPNMDDDIIEKEEFFLFLQDYAMILTN